MKLLSSLILVLVSVSSFADIPPRPRPTPALDAKTVQVLDAVLSAKASDLKAFMSAGNTVTAGTVRAVTSDQTLYTVTRQNCTSGSGFAGPSQCLGGAQLQVTVENVRSGEMVRKVVTSSVQFLK